MQPISFLLTFEVKIILSWHLEMRILGTTLLDPKLCENRFSILFWLRQSDIERLRN